MIRPIEWKVLIGFDNAALLVSGNWFNWCRCLFLLWSGHRCRNLFGTMVPFISSNFFLFVNSNARSFWFEFTLFIRTFRTLISSKRCLLRFYMCSFLSCVTKSLLREIKSLLKCANLLIFSFLWILPLYYGCIRKIWVYAASNENFSAGNTSGN